MTTRKLSRRAFMEATTGAAGAAWAGKALPLDATQIPTKAAAPSDAVRFGIVGIGMRGSDLLAQSIKLPGVECAGACDLYDGRVELAKEIIGKPVTTTKRYQDLLERKDIDCILAPVPDHWHHNLVMDALSAGKDVYVEKPMTHEVPEGFSMIAAADRYHRIVQVGSQEPSSVVYHKAKALLESKVVGDVCLIESSLGRNSPCGAWVYGIPPDLSPETLDWNTWLGPAPKHAFSRKRWARWRCWMDYGEGVTGDLFVHSLTGIHYLMGVTAPPLRASSSGGLFRWRDGRDVPDVLTTAYDYPGFRVTLRVTLNTGEDEITRVMGPGGMMKILGIENPNAVTVWPEDGKNHGPCDMAWPQKLADPFEQKWHAEHDLKPGTGETVEASGWYAPPHYSSTRDHLWNFFQSVKTRRPSVEDAVFGNNAAIACHMANYSYFNKCVAVWDAEQKRITRA